MLHFSDGNLIGEVLCRLEQGAMQTSTIAPFIRKILLVIRLCAEKSHFHGGELAPACLRAQAQYVRIHCCLKFEVPVRNAHFIATRATFNDQCPALLFDPVAHRLQGPTTP